jgi:DNA helicase-2/ATP-dependent DNA helicase PcrA
VAADEIRKRSPYKKLHVSTIHDFLWMIIKNFHQPLKKSFFDLLQDEKQVKGTGIAYSGEVELNNDSFDKIEYRNYRKLENGVISHDDLIKIALNMFANYPLLSKIVCDKYDYIFIDEYQDTDKKVIMIFLEYIYKNATKKKLCVGFFGDRMQSIYDTGIGNIQDYVDNKIVIEVPKQDNYRCSKKVIEFINKIRKDGIKQKPSLKNADGNILNSEGSVSFLYSSQTDFDLDGIKNQDIFTDWDFEDPQKTKILFLTHKLIAKRYGFENILEA